jgi:hypothetical protein
MADMAKALLKAMMHVQMMIIVSRTFGALSISRELDTTAVTKMKKTPGFANTRS